MRPSPIIPSCMSLPFAGGQRGADNPGEVPELGDPDLAPDVDAVEEFVGVLDDARRR